MNALFVALCAVVAAGSCAGSVIKLDVSAPIADGAVLQGPGTKTHVVGPDGSEIVAEAPGGRVDVSGVVAAQEAVLAATVPHEEEVVVETVDAAPEIVAAKAVELDSVAVEASPVVAASHVETVVPHVAKTSVAAHSLDQVHPSPAVIAHAAKVIAQSAPIYAHAAPIVAHSVPVVAHSSSVVAHSAKVLTNSAAVYAHAAPVVAVRGGPIVSHAASVVSAEPLVAYISAPVVASGRLLAHDHAAIASW